MLRRATRSTKQRDDRVGKTSRCGGLDETAVNQRPPPARVKPEPRHHTKAPLQLPDLGAKDGPGVYWDGRVR
jgi:hypothetical protein